MRKFTTTELKFNRPMVWNEVADNGVAIISHRDRPDMYLMSQRYMAEKMASTFEEGKKSVK